MSRMQANGSPVGEGARAAASSEDRFLRLKAQLHQQLIANMELSAIGSMKDEDLRREVRRAAEELTRQTSDLLNLTERERLVGEVIDETTLAKMLDTGEIAGAGLDVFEHEPAVNPRLVKLAKAGRVVLLPHMGSATIEGRTDMGEKVIVNIRALMDGHSPPDKVLPSML